METNIVRGSGREQFLATEATTLFCMEDGPEAAEGTYELNGETFELRENESEVWSVYRGGQRLGDVIAVAPGAEGAGPQYTVRFADELPEGEYTDEWQAALEYLINQSGA